MKTPIDLIGLAAVAKLTENGFAIVKMPCVFAVGERVRLKRRQIYGVQMFAAEDGATARVKAVSVASGMGVLLDLVWDRNELDHGQNDGGYSPDAFERAA